MPSSPSLPGTAKKPDATGQKCCVLGRESSWRGYSWAERVALRGDRGRSDRNEMNKGKPGAWKTNVSEGSS